MSKTLLIFFFLIFKGFTNLGDASADLTKKFEILESKDDIFNELMSTQGKRDVDLNYNEIINFKADISMIRQVFINLLSNALKFTKNGIVHLGCLMIDSSSVVFFVKDSGTGIPGEVLTKLFKRYEQADNATFANNPNGAGLGLSISKGLIDLLKGEIWVDSKVGEGTTFYFKIPVKFPMVN